MTVRQCSVFLTTVFLFTGLFANARAQASTFDPVLAPIAKLKAAFNANDDKAVQALFSPTAVVVDEVTPYRWTGPTAALRWLHDDGVVIAKNGVKNARITIGAPAFVHRTATSMYTVMPLVDAYVVGGRPQRETGLLTVVFVKRRSAWKISLLAFAKQSDTSDISWRRTRARRLRSS